MATETKSKSKLPYLIRALHEWIVDSELTPYLMVSVDSDQVQVPADYVSDGKIVLNVSPFAIRDFLVADAGVSFAGRFAGRAFDVYLPTSCVLAIYAKETGEGMVFEGYADSVSIAGSPDDPEPPQNSDPPKGAPPKGDPPKGDRHLQVIK